MGTYPGIYAYKYGDLYTLGAFAAGYQGAQDDSDLGQMLAMGGILGSLPLVKSAVWDGPKWLIQNRGNYTTAWNTHLAAVKARRNAANAFKESLKGGENRAYNWLMRNVRYQNYQGIRAKSIQPRYDTKLVRELTKAGKTEEISAYKEAFKMQKKRSDCYKEARLILNRIKKQGLKGEQLRIALKELEGAIYKGDLKAGAIKPVGKWAKAWNFVKQKSGYNKLNRGLLKGMTHGLDDSGKVIAGVGDKAGSKALRTIAKGAKGGGLLTAGIEMAFEAPEIVETYKTMGVGAGTKQLAKSATVATASAVGWVVGAKAGAAIGTAICPGIGTAIGGAIGVIGGLLGSWLFNKGAKAIVGKSELEKYKEKQALQLAQNAQNSREGKQELLEAAKAKADAQGGVDDQSVIAAYENLLNERQASLQGGGQGTSQQSQYNESEYNSKSSLLAQLENFNVNGYSQASNPFATSQSIFSNSNSAMSDLLFNPYSSMNYNA